MIETAEARDILRPFGLAPSESPKYVFESPLVYAAGDIREAYLISNYDHKPNLPGYDQNHAFIQTEQFRRGYAAFKHCVARVLQPRSIVEIGIGSGVAAFAFLAACPEAHYTGIDDGSKDKEESGMALPHVRHILDMLDRKYEIIIKDSMKLPSAPKADLFHVDGGHDYEHALNDCRLAWGSGSEWILVDDARDPTVASAAMLAAFSARVMFHWAYFEDTWTGSILFHRVSG
jgi:Methyltransferase domain